MFPALLRLICYALAALILAAELFNVRHFPATIVVVLCALVIFVRNYMRPDSDGATR